MKIEDLKNTKIYLSNKDDRVKFLEKVFKLGVEWIEGSPRIIITWCPFFYIDSNLKLRVDSSPQSQFLLEYKDKQIFLDDVLAIEEPTKYEFKPFEKVLVREENFLPWRPGIFSYLDNWNDESPYVIIPQKSYKYCIPYKGNEHLCGVNN